MKRHYDWVIVGAGFTGAVVAERLASTLDKRVLVIDRRPHIAGNAYDCPDANGILFHQYGPHIFHTNSDQVLAYLSRFTQWMPYEHRVVAVINGRLVPVPFNLTSLAICFPAAKAGRLAATLIETYGMDVKVPILKLRQADNPAIRELADYIYESVFHNYTVKQWGLTPEQLGPQVMGRVPVHISYDDRYFQDVHQVMPCGGYTALFERMLSSDRITLGLGEDFSTLGADVTYDRMLFTGAIDEFFSFSLGALPYRSLSFDFQHVRQERHQPVGTVNYPNEQAYTRITEQRYLTQQPGRDTLLTIEYPRAHVPGETEPYYPVPREENQALHSEYVRLAKIERPEIIFAGRLGNYQYYNMDQAVGHALAVFHKQILPLHGATREQAGGASVA